MWTGAGYRAIGGNAKWTRVLRTHPSGHREISRRAPPPFTEENPVPSPQASQLGLWQGSDPPGRGKRHPLHPEGKGGVLEYIGNPYASAGQYIVLEAVRCYNVYIPMLTKDELDQIRGVVREEVTEAEKRLNGRMDSLDL